MPYEPPTRVTPGDALACLWLGLRVGLGEPRLRRRLAASLVVNALAFLALVALLLWGAFALIGLLAGGGEVAADASWLATAWAWIREALGWMLRAAAVVGALFIAPVLFNLVGSLLLPMFHGPVFNAAREHAGGPPVEGAPGGFRATAQVIATETRRLRGFLAVTLALLPLNLVPGVGSAVYLVAQFLVSARGLAWDLLSYHFELHGLTFEEQKRFLAARPLLTVTLGGAATLLCMIPVAQLLFVTTNVAGAGLLSARMDGAPSRRG